MRCHAFQFFLLILFYQYVTVLHGVSRKGIIIAMTWIDFAKTIAAPNFHLKQLNLNLRHLSSDSFQVAPGSGD